MTVGPGASRVTRHATLAALALMLVATTCPARVASGSSPGGGPTVGRAPEAPAIRLEAVATGLAQPVAVTHAGDGSARLFIVQQGGQVLVHDETGLRPTPFLDLSSLVLPGGGAEGLLGVAFHPHYAGNGYFYVDYTRRPDGATVVARYAVSADPNVADPGSGAVLLTIPQPSAYHHGGQLQFGPDGYLYIGLGDGSLGDPDNRAQNLADLRGKLLRIDVNGAAPYAIPPDNPFLGTPGARPEIWALGLRNPWRFSFDRQTGDLFIADVGQALWEEVDFQPARAPGGANYGWRLMEGFHCFIPPSGCNPGTLTLPILEYSHGFGTGNCAIVGGYRYRGALFPALQGWYVYGDFCSGRIWGASPGAGGQWTTTELLDTALTLSTFGEDEDGTLYVADHAAGVVYRLEAALFADVLPDHWAAPYIEALYRAGVTAGCAGAPRAYCPDRPVTRGEMAVLLLRAKEGGAYTPPPCTSPSFPDVPCTSPVAPWIEELARRGVTAGCDAGGYCPDRAVTREEMAVFLLRTLAGPGIPPLACSTPTFADVPCSSPFAPWVEDLARRGIAAGCAGSLYCPRRDVTRAEMAVLLVRTFGL